MTSDCMVEVTDEWYDKLREEVDFHCTFCEAIHLKIQELEDVISRAYALTAQAVRNTYDDTEIRNHWYGMWALACEVVSVGEMMKEEHQICAPDLERLVGFRNAAHERFRLHCPPKLAVK